MRYHLGLFAAMICVANPTLVHAGMPSIRFSDVASLRLQGISFFLVGLLLSAAAVKGLWNWLRTDFERLPRLSYGKACGIVVLWGLLFIVVLTMISGARELMTPGAWEKQALTYRLSDEHQPSPQTYERSDPDLERKRQLARLNSALQSFAREHDGAMPTREEASLIADDRWMLPDITGLKYVYLPDRRFGNTDILAYEPDVFDGDPFVLLANGEIIRMSRAKIRQASATASLQ